MADNTANALRMGRFSLTGLNRSEAIRDNLSKNFTTGFTPLEMRKRIGREGRKGVLEARSCGQNGAGIKFPHFSLTVL